MKLFVPFNSKARVLMTKDELEKLTINGKTWSHFSEYNRRERMNGSTIVLVPGNTT